jgi:hypothetical protein
LECRSRLTWMTHSGWWRWRQSGRCGSGSGCQWPWETWRLRSTTTGCGMPTCTAGRGSPGPNFLRGGELCLPALARNARHAGHKGGSANFAGLGGEAERSFGVGGAGCTHDEGAHGTVRPVPPARHRRAGGPKVGSAFRGLCVHAVPEGQQRGEHAVV